MKQRSILWQAAGFALVTFGGTILHFLYGWTGGSILVSPFSGVNESTWEHMKLLFWPLFLFALVQRLFFKDQENYWCVKLVEILLGLVLIRFTPTTVCSENPRIGSTSPSSISPHCWFLSLSGWCLSEIGCNADISGFLSPQSAKLVDSACTLERCRCKK